MITQTNTSAFYAVVEKACLTDKFSGAHSVHTPKNLIEEILNKINLNGTILVMYNVEFVISLVYTYDVNPDAITFYSDHENKNIIIKRLGVTKYITTLGTDMKFDVVLGNPPYQDDSTGNSTKTTNLYTPIFYKGLELVKPNGILSMIIPSDWIGPNNSSFKNFMFNHRELKEITLHPYQKYFKVKKGTCNVIIDKTYNGDCRFEDVNGNVQMLDLKSVSFLSNDNTNIAYRNLFGSHSSMGHRWLRGKLNLNKIVTANTGHEFIVSCGKSGSSLNTITIPESLEQTGFGIHKIVLPNVGGTTGELGNNVKIAEPHHVGGHSVVFLTTASKAESLNLLTYLNTTPIKALIKSVKKSSPNSKALFNQIPDVDLSKSWDNSRVYKHFKFNQQMIDYAESI